MGGFCIDDKAKSLRQPRSGAQREMILPTPKARSTRGTVVPAGISGRYTHRGISLSETTCKAVAMRKS